MNELDRKFSTSLLIPDGLGASRVFGEMEVKAVKELTAKAIRPGALTLKNFG